MFSRFFRAIFSVAPLDKPLAYIACRVLPKFDYAIVYGWPDYEDSALALQEALNKTRIRKVIFVTGGRRKNSAFCLQQKTKVFHKKNIRARLYCLFSKYVFFTHRCFMWRFPPNVVSVNVWHGMPIKRVGRMLEGEPELTGRYTLATSEFWADIMRKAMAPWDRVLVTGLPRNDRLFSNPNSVWSRLGFSNDSFRKKIAWLPTFRNAVCGSLYRDGKESGNIFGMTGVTAEKLNEFLKQQNAFAFVKPHPMARFEKNVELSNLLVVDDQWLRDRGLTLYEVLGQMDILVSDISSVVVDYLILDRPVIHSFPDLAEYESSRGFSINPVTDYLVGPVATNVEELYGCLAQVLQGDDSHAEQRRRIRKLFHKNTDDNSTNRLLQHLGLLLK